MIRKLERNNFIMKIIALILLILIAFIIFYIFSLRGRVGFADWSQFRGYYYAHRGLHNKTNVPENSLEAFRRAVDKGYGIEFDVHLLSDGELAIIHDSSLLRTAGVDVKVEDLKSEDLKNYFLEGTAETIPTLEKTLSLVDGKTPLIIELKTSGNNVNDLCERVYETLKEYSGAYCIESFDPRCLYWFYKNKPEVIRGQLSENYYKSKTTKAPFVIKFLMTGLFTNFLTRPDFIAYKFSDRATISNKICTKVWKMQSVGWTITDENNINKAKLENVFPIFEDIYP